MNNSIKYNIDAVAGILSSRFLVSRISTRLVSFRSVPIYLFQLLAVSALVMSLFLTASPASATSLLPINLQQLSTRAALIFYAEAVRNQTRKDPQSGRIATFTEFRIIESIKGDEGKADEGDTHTIKQLGGYDKTSAIRVSVHGVPVFETGKQYIVFLPEKSSLGFCSPLGLRQGVFSVFNSEGETIVSNGHNLTTDNTISNSTGTETGNPGQPGIESYSSSQVPLAVRADNPTQSRLDDFINTVRAYNTP